MTEPLSPNGTHPATTSSTTRTESPRGTASGAASAGVVAVGGSRPFPLRGATSPTEDALGAILYLSREDVEGLGISYPDVRGAVHDALAEKGRGLVESPPKRGVVPRENSSIRAMKAFLPSRGMAGVKWISAFPGNVDRGLPTIAGLVVLNDIETGLPRAIMDCSWITAIRTAACTEVAATYLARPESSTLGLVACGLQGWTNLRALCSRFPIRRVHAYDLQHERAGAFAEAASHELGIEVVPVRTVKEAVTDLDIVVTSCPIEKDPRPTIEPGWLAAGSFAAPLDFDASFQGEALRQAHRFFTDDVRQFSFFKEIGYLRETPEPDGDLGKVVTGRLPGRCADEETIVSMNLGIGVLDIAVASLIYERARASGAGRELPR